MDVLILVGIIVVPIVVLLWIEKTATGAPRRPREDPDLQAHQRSSRAHLGKFGP